MVILDTDLPSTIPHYTKDVAQFRSAAMRDHGEEYAKQFFPDVPLEVINGRSDTPRFKFSKESDNVTQE